MPGRANSFSPNQLGTLRRAFREWNAEQERSQPRWSQARAGAAIGVSQQVAGRFLGKEDVGISYPTAVQIAKHAGFDSLDDFFRSYGVHASDAGTVEPGAPDRWRWRDLATTVARRIGVSDAAIAAATSRYTEQLYRGRDAKWWVAKMLAEDADLASLPDRSPPPAPAPAEPAVEPTRPKRRRAS